MTRSLNPIVSETVCTFDTRARVRGNNTIRLCNSTTPCSTRAAHAITTTSAISSHNRFTRRYVRVFCMFFFYRTISSFRRRYLRHLEVNILSFERIKHESFQCGSHGARGFKTSKNVRNNTCCGNVDDRPGPGEIITDAD